VLDDHIVTKIALVKTIKLSVKAGKDAACFMAANTGFLVAGTDLGGMAGEVNKSTYAERPIRGSGLLAEIQANNEDFVVVKFSKNGVVTYKMVAPNGTVRESGGGSPLIPNPITAIRY
jgi:hypothetical protein